ncbi:hypothetical protein V6N11_071936 [Hibiscus sabdariffa]|uniref:SAC domain-containing protein n=1 Tax=Hibiscus sabdariffa TaxID=183260 RepID=A0ABR2U1L8_9ROSI
MRWREFTNNGLLNCVEPKQVSTTEISTEVECSDNLLEPQSTQGIVSTELVDKECEPLLTVSNEVEVFNKLPVIADVESDGFDDSVSGLLKVPLDEGCDILNRGLLKPSSIQGIWLDSLMAMRGMNFSETGVLEERLQINDALLTMRESVHLVIDCPFDRGGSDTTIVNCHDILTTFCKESESGKHVSRYSYSNWTIALVHGTRYLEGRVNDRGRVAFDVETEQIVFDESSIIINNDHAGWEAVGETSMHSLVTGNGLLTNSSCGIQKDEVMVMEKFKTDAANGKESCGETVKPSMFQTGVLGSNYTSVGQYVY